MSPCFTFLTPLWLLLRMSCGLVSRTTGSDHPRCHSLCFCAMAGGPQLSLNPHKRSYVLACRCFVWSLCTASLTLSSIAQQQVFDTWCQAHNANVRAHGRCEPLRVCNMGGLLCVDRRRT